MLYFKIDNDWYNYSGCLFDVTDETGVPIDFAPRGEYCTDLADIWLGQKAINKYSDFYGKDIAVSTIELTIGRALGLKYSKNEKSVMGGGQEGCPIQPCDVQAVKKMYHEK